MKTYASAAKLAFDAFADIKFGDGLFTWQRFEKYKDDPGLLYDHMKKFANVMARTCNGHQLRCPYQLPPDLRDRKNVVISMLQYFNSPIQGGDCIDYDSVVGCVDQHFG